MGNSWSTGDTHESNGHPSFSGQPRAIFCARRHMGAECVAQTCVHHRCLAFACYTHAQALSVATVYLQCQNVKLSASLEHQGPQVMSLIMRSMCKVAHLWERASHQKGACVRP